MTAARVEYPNPPIVEALCQLYFAEPIKWNPATTGLIFSKVADQYPRDPEEQVATNFGFGVNGPDQSVPNFVINQGGSRFIYRDVSESRLLVINAESISANCLPPYESWPSLRERLRGASDALAEILGQTLIKQVTIRYINRIQVPDIHGEPLSSFFNVPVRYFSVAPANIDEVLTRTSAKLDDEHGTVAIATFATAVPEPAEVDRGTLFILDLEFRRAFADPLSLADAMSQADELKVIENAEFESYLTDVTRGLFR